MVAVDRTRFPFAPLAIGGWGRRRLARSKGGQNQFFKLVNAFLHLMPAGACGKFGDPVVESNCIYAVVGVATDLAILAWPLSVAFKSKPIINGFLSNMILHGGTAHFRI